ncbi:hypothetical protein CES85_2273 [Ochrobactrum quorumnocens]|uniref:Uncharacterized protein n=1 Tax=Ochrobactrum quorumnocens TaxID=271865 RepID=A0A248UIV7_9HYPH|nr:hypothetical protein CES85_2273 [[Ochrobactrum] quorumnocens]
MPAGPPLGALARDGPARDVLGIKDSGKPSDEAPRVGIDCP